MYFISQIVMIHPTYYYILHYEIYYEHSTRKMLDIRILIFHDFNLKRSAKLSSEIIRKH